MRWLKFTTIAVLILASFWLGRSNQVKPSRDFQNDTSTSGFSSQRDEISDLKNQLVQKEEDLRRAREELDRLAAGSTMQKNAAVLSSNGRRLANEAAEKDKAVESVKAEEEKEAAQGAADAEPSQTAPTVAVDLVIEELAKQEKSFTQEKRASDDRPFLSKVAIKDLNAVEGKLKSLKKADPNVERMYGKYRGAIVFSNKKRKRGRITLILQEPVAKPFVPAVRVEVLDGKSAQTTHIGGVDQLKKLGGKGEAMFIESSDRSYMQFYFIDEHAMIVGNFYEKNAAGLHVKVGTFKLTRLDA